MPDRWYLIGTSFLVFWPSLYLWAAYSGNPFAEGWRSRWRRGFELPLQLALAFMPLPGDVIRGQWGDVVPDLYRLAVFGWLWWKFGGGRGQARRLRERAAAVVAVAGSRLRVVVAVPAPA